MVILLNNFVDYIFKQLLINDLNHLFNYYEKFLSGFLYFCN